MRHTPFPVMITAGIILVMIALIPAGSADEFDAMDDEVSKKSEYDAMDEEEPNNIESDAMFLRSGVVEGSVGINGSDDPVDYYRIVLKSPSDVFILFHNQDQEGTIHMRVYSDLVEEFHKDFDPEDQGSVDLYAMDPGEVYFLEITGKGNYTLESYFEPYVREPPPDEYYYEDNEDISYSGPPIVTGLCCMVFIVVLILAALAIGIIIAIRKLNED